MASMDSTGEDTRDQDLSWPPGSREQQADSETDSEHRRLRERAKKEKQPERKSTKSASTSNKNRVQSSKKTPARRQSRRMNQFTPLDYNLTTPRPAPSSEPEDDRDTISDNGEARDEEVAETVIPVERNGYNHNADDFKDFYKELKLAGDFFKRFHGFIKAHHDGDDEVQAALKSGTEQSLKDVASDFLDSYGNKVWKLKGKNAHQDRKLYRDTLFDIRTDEDRLLPILTELWRHVRGLLYTTAPLEADAAAEELPIPIPAPAQSPAGPGPWTVYGNRSNDALVPGPLPAEIPSKAENPEEWEDTPEEQAIMANFINKVNRDRAKKK